MAQQRETNCAKEIPDERNTQRRPKWETYPQTNSNEFQAEVQLLKIRVERHKSNYTKVEEEMAKFLQNKFNGNEPAELKKLWDEDIANGVTRKQSRSQSGNQNKNGSKNTNSNSTTKI